MWSGQEPHAAGGAKSSHLCQEGTHHQHSVVEYIALAPSVRTTSTPSWSTLRSHLGYTQHQHSVVQRSALAPRVCAAPALRRNVNCTSSRSGPATPPWSTFRLRRQCTQCPAPVDELGSALKRLFVDCGEKKEHGLVRKSQCSPNTSQMSLVECGHFGHFLVRGAACYWVGFHSPAVVGGANLDRPANCFLHAGAHLREEQNLHLSKEHAHEGAYLDQS